MQSKRSIICQKGYILCYFYLQAWLGEIYEYAQDDVVIMLLGNKSDMNNEKVIRREDGERLARVKSLCNNDSCELMLDGYGEEYIFYPCLFEYWSGSQLSHHYNSLHYHQMVNGPLLDLEFTRQYVVYCAIKYFFCRNITLHSWKPVPKQD